MKSYVVRSSSAQPVYHCAGKIIGFFDSFYTIETTFGVYSKVPSLVGKCSLNDIVLVYFGDAKFKRHPMIVHNNSSILGQARYRKSQSSGIGFGLLEFWPQGLGNIQKNGLGLSTLNYALMNPPTEFGWFQKFTFSSPKRITSSRDVFWPSLVIAKENRLKQASQTEIAVSVSTMFAVTYDHEGGSVTTKLHLFSMSRAFVADTNIRGEISSLVDLNGTPFGPDFPLEIFTSTPAFSTAFGDAMLAPISSVYLRTHDLDGTTNCTILEPPILTEGGTVHDAPSTVTREDNHGLISNGALNTIDLEFTVLGTITYVKVGHGGTYVDYSLGEDPDVDNTYTFNAETNQVTLRSPESEDEFDAKIGYTSANNPVFRVAEIILSRQGTSSAGPSWSLNHSDIPPSRINAYLESEAWLWEGFMGPTHISVANNVMVQAHPAAEKVTISALNPADQLTWTPKEAKTWDQLLPMDMDGDRHHYPWEFVSASRFSNYAPAKYKDHKIVIQVGGITPPISVDSSGQELVDGFVFPSFTLYTEDIPNLFRGYNFKSYLWLVKLQYDAYGSDGLTHQAFKLLQRDSPSPGQPTTLTSIASASEAALRSFLEGVLDVIFDHLYSEDRLFGYSCIDQVVSCDGDQEYGPWDCTDPCYIDLCTTPEGSGCVCWDASHHEILLGVTSYVHSWKGYQEGRKVSFFGQNFPSLFSPLPEQDELNNVLIPLPAGRPNTLSPDISRCTWTSKSRGSGDVFSGSLTIDPQVVVNPANGSSYFCFVQGSFVYIPTGDYSNFVSNIISSEQEGVEEGMVLCEERYSHAYSNIYTTCESCYGEDGYVDEGRYIISAAYHLPDYTNPGSTHTEYSYYQQRQVLEVRQTFLAITDKSGTSTVTIPVSRKFSGVPFTGGYLENYSIAEELPVAENVWQLGVIKDVLLMLRDDRENFRDSPRPILEVRSLNGEVLSTYKNLIPADLYAQVFDSEDDGRYIGECKWNLHGQILANGDTPGPRLQMESAWANSCQRRHSRPAIQSFLERSRFSASLHSSVSRDVGKEALRRKLQDPH